MLFGSGFEEIELREDESSKATTAKKVIVAYEYSAWILGKNRMFKFFSPSYLGKLPHISIKVPKKSGKGQKVIRNKVVFTDPVKMNITKDQFEMILSLNRNIWSYIIPGLESGYNEASFETAKEGKMFAKKSYTELVKQFLILPMMIPKGSASPDLDNKLGDKLVKGLSKAKKIKKTQIYAINHEKEGLKLYIVQDLIPVSHVLFGDERQLQRKHSRAPELDAPAVKWIRVQKNQRSEEIQVLGLLV
jgi:hypothetical protein